MEPKTVPKPTEKQVQQQRGSPVQDGGRREVAGGPRKLTNRGSAVVAVLEEAKLRERSLRSFEELKGSRRKYPEGTADLQAYATAADLLDSLDSWTRGFLNS